MYELNTIAFPVGHFPSGGFPDGHWPKPYDPSSYTCDPYLEKPPSYILSKLLIANDNLEAANVDIDWPVYVSDLPDLIQNSACVYDTTPVIEPDITVAMKTIRYGIQVALRSIDYAEGTLKGEELVNYLSVIRNNDVFVDDKLYRIHKINFFSGLASIGKDKLRRNLFTINLLMLVSSLI